MRRPATRRLALALLLTVCALWLAPLALEPDTAPASVRIVRTPPAATISSAPAAPAPVALPPAAGTVFTIEESPGVPRAYAVALDELYLPARPTSRRLVAIAPLPDLGSLLSHAAGLAADTPAADAPRLVLYPVGAPRNAVTRRIVNPRIVVALASASAPLPAARPDLGIVAWERPAYAPDHAIAHIAGDAVQPLRAAAAAASLPGVRSASPLLARQHFHRRILNDPVIGSQWHLRNIRANAAWDSATGSGVVVAVVDDGVDLGHADLAPALNSSLGYDWNGNDTIPYAEDHYVDGYPEEDNHGTAVAGLAGARGGNRLGGAGSAPSATLAALRLIAAPTDPSEDAAAMSWRNDVISIKNNSWGPYDYDPDVRPAPNLLLSALADGASQGRNGRGILYFWAAGNGQRDGDQGSLDGYASGRHVIAVAASAKGGGVASFSEGGPHLVVAAPGAGGIVTTDRTGIAGYTKSDYTSGFAGTSAATPIASGVGALLLEARPDLGWRDVKEIFLRSSTKLQGSGSDWVSRAAGDAARPVKHHPRFGGGNVNALAALALAKDWVPLGPETSIDAYPSNVSDLAITDLPSVPRRISFTIPEGSPLLRVEHAVLKVHITHPRRSDLEISLTSPSATDTQTVSRFTTGVSPLAGEDFFEYPFTSVRHWGEPSAIPGDTTKKWVLTIRDIVPSNAANPTKAGTFHSATLTLYGTTLAAPQKLADLSDLNLATGSTLVLRAAFSGGNLDYKWRRDGQLIAGANTAELRLPNFSAKLAGTYTCTVENPLGSASVSAVATLDDSPRAAFDFRSGAIASLDLGDYLDGDIKLWKSTALPAGLRLDAATGLITGRPTKPGASASAVIVTATKPDGTVVRLPLRLNITPLPGPLAGRHVMGVGIDANGSIDFERKGLLTLTVSANGRATGQFHSGARLRSFAVVLDKTEDGGASFVHSFTVLGATRRLTVNIAPDGESSGTFEEIGQPIFMPITGHASPWNAKTQPATAYASRFTAAFGQNWGDLSRMKRCLLEMNVGPDGIAKWRLLPSDGSPALTGSTPLGAEGQLLLFATYAKQKGAIFGEFALPAAPLQELAEDISLRWDRAPAPTWLEPAGFYNQTLPLRDGGRYSPPASGQRLLGYTVGGPTLEIRGDDFDHPEPLVAGVTVDAANRFVIPAPNPLKFKLTTTAATGWVTGTYRGTIPDAANPDAVRGVSVQFAGLVLSTSGQVSGFVLTPYLPDGTSPYCTEIMIRPEQPAE